MSGIPEERGRNGAEDPAEDTTAAQNEPPAHRHSRPDALPPSSPPVDSTPDEPHGADEEDRTVQQQVAPSVPRKPPPAPAAGRPPSIRVSASPPAAEAPIPSSDAPIVSAVASTEPGPKQSASADARARVSVTEADEIAADDLTDDAEEDLEDDDPIEDSITATAPRLDGGRLAFTLPGSIEIRTADDDMLDETEVRTRPGHIPLDIPPALRAQLDQPQPSQPPPPPRTAAGAPPSAGDRERAAPTMMAAGVAAASSSSSEADSSFENDDDGVTTQAVAPRVASVPDFGAPLLSVVSAKVPSTERSATAPAAAKAAPRELVVDAGIDASAGIPAIKAVAPLPIVEDTDDLLTRPGLEGALEPATSPGVPVAEEPATRPGLPAAAVDDPPTRPGIIEANARPASKANLEARPPTDSYANEDDDDGESITKRGMPTGFEDSVTASLPESVVAAATARSAMRNASVTIDDGTEGTTKKVKKPRLDPSASPADGETESITTQAPGPLTNMLRVIAADPPADETPKGGIEPLIDDEPLENRTAVMANAPLKRIIDEHIAHEHIAQAPLNPIRPTGPPITTHVSAQPLGPMGSAAPRLEPSSESGLRARTASMEQQSVDRASMGMLGLASNDLRPSGIARSAHHSENHQSLGPMEPLGGFTHPQPSVHDVDLGKGPSYGLLVAIVAGVSILVPAALFLMLNRAPEPTAPETVAEPVSDIQKQDAPRSKAERGKNGVTIAPQPSASSSAQKKKR